MGVSPLFFCPGFAEEEPDLDPDAAGQATVRKKWTWGNAGASAYRSYIQVNSAIAYALGLHTQYAKPGTEVLACGTRAPSCGLREKGSRTRYALAPYSIVLLFRYAMSSTVLRACRAMSGATVRSAAARTRGVIPGGDDVRSVAVCR